LLNYTQPDPEKCEFIVIAETADLPNGERMYVEIDDEVIVIFNIAGGYFAIADVCSHDGGPLGDGELYPETYEISCPRHGARFDVRSGQVTCYPAVEDIAAYPVRVNAAGGLELGLPVN